MKAQISLLLLLAGALALSAGCETGEQPPECELFLTCFYPADDSNSPDTVDGRQTSDEVREEAQAAFGSEGECWRNGPNDPFFRICRRTCVDILVDECSRGPERPCVETTGGVNVFKPPESDPAADAPTCSSLETLGEELKTQTTESDAPASGG